MKLLRAMRIIASHPSYNEVREYADTQVNDLLRRGAITEGERGPKMLGAALGIEEFFKYVDGADDLLEKWEEARSMQNG